MSENERNYPICGARKRQGEGVCQNKAGKKTDHVGEGRCYLHGGVGQKPSLRYQEMHARPRLKQLIEQFAEDDDPLNLTHELTLLRALVLDFIERYDETTQALLAWHASFNGDFELKLRRWRSDVAAWLEEAENDRNEPATPFPVPPYPEEHKPRQMVDITAAAGFIDRIGALADRIEKRKREGMISLATLDRVLEQLGAELVAACQEVRLDPVQRTALLATTERRWGNVRLDSPVGSPGATPRPNQLN